MKEKINQMLLQLMSHIKESKVKEAMIYSLMGNGKRLRPLILLTTLKSYSILPDDYLDIACSIEMVHTYSLIHDDLPGMDNDDLRRGRPTCHKAFGEAVAILAGDGLLNEAMNVILNSQANDSLKVKLAHELFTSSGINGMIYGQNIDMELSGSHDEKKEASLKDIQNIHKYKTGQLIKAPFMMAGIIAQREEDLPYLNQLGLDLGLAFQIQDDILDVTSDTETLGKNANSDIKNHKSTYVTLLGLDKAQEMLETLHNKCLEDIYHLKVNHGLLIQLLENIYQRVN